MVAGRYHVCAIDTEQDLYCWGKNHAGQLGLGNRVDATSPQKVVGGLQWLQVRPMWEGTCALAFDRDVYCWGMNSNWHLGQQDVLKLQPKMILTP